MIREASSRMRFQAALNCFRHKTIHFRLSAGYIDRVLAQLLLCESRALTSNADKDAAHPVVASSLHFS